MTEIRLNGNEREGRGLRPAFYPSDLSGGKHESAEMKSRTHILPFFGLRGLGFAGVEEVDRLYTADENNLEAANALLAATVTRVKNWCDSWIALSSACLIIVPRKDECHLVD